LQELQYYICDFGSCRDGPINVASLTKPQKNTLKEYIESHSTIMYRSPEMIQPSNIPITGKSDLWMLGCVAYLLLFYRHPFEGEGLLGIVTANIDFENVPKMKEEEYGRKETVEKIVKVVRGMLRPDVGERFDERTILTILNL
jgi:serine/threonine protein kinase